MESSPYEFLQHCSDRFFTYSEGVMPGGRNVLSLEGSLPPLGSSWMTLGLEVSPPSAGDEK